MNNVLDFLALLFGIRTSNNTEGYTPQRLRFPQGFHSLLKGFFLLVAGGTVFLFLASLLTQSYFKERNTERRMTHLGEIIAQYQKETAQLPSHLQEVIQNKPLVRDLTIDSWGNSFDYKVDLTKKAFLLSSAGKDQTHGTSDDLVQEVHLTSVY